MSNVFSALDKKHYTKNLLDYMNKEGLLLSKLTKNKRILDIWCWTGNVLEYLKDCKSYIGIDPDQNACKKSSELIDELDIKWSIIQTTYEQFKSSNNFDYVICLFNTIVLLRNKINAIKRMGSLAKEGVFLTCIAKNYKVFESRIEYYENAGINYRVEDEQTIVSDIWGTSKAYSQDELKDLVISSWLNIIDFWTLWDIGYAHYIIASNNMI